MSDAEDTLDELHDLPIEQQVRQLANRVTELEKENRVLRERLEERPTFEWDGYGLLGLTVTHPENGQEYKLGQSVAYAMDEEVWGDRVEDLEDTIDKVKMDRLETTDLLSGNVEPKLPIEEKVRQAGNPATRDDLTANQERAVAVFRAFGGRAESWSGVKKLTSHQVKTILDEKGWTDPNNNTVKRVMKMLAKLTSDQPPADRDPYDDENLLTLKKESRLTLAADAEEWREYTRDVEERYGDGSSVTLS